MVVILKTAQSLFRLMLQFSMKGKVLKETDKIRLFIVRDINIFLIPLFKWYFMCF
jgi:hypothetical protein